MADCRSYVLYNNPLLKAKAFVRAERVTLDVSGPLAHLPMIKSALQMFDGQIPVLAAEKLHLSTWIPPVPSKAFDRLANSRVKGLLGVRTPDQVTISITEVCPNHCAHCALPDSGISCNCLQRQSLTSSTKSWRWEPHW